MLFEYLLLLLLGHILGDFYFQTEIIAKLKDQKYMGVLWHSLEYFGAGILVMLPVFSVEMLSAALFAAIMHFVIDTIKYLLLKVRRINKNGKTFILDQMLHVISILILSYIMYIFNFNISHFSIVNNIFIAFGIDKLVLIKWIISILILHIPSNILIQNLLNGYKTQKSDGQIIEVDNKAGRKIGTIERLIMLMFISMDQYAAMGLVLTAKSIARYDRITKDEKFAEYYLLGTLLSTAMVVACKVIFFT